VTSSAGFIKIRKGEADQLQLFAPRRAAPAPPPRAASLEPMDHWIRDPRQRPPETDMAWLRDFVPPPPGWSPAIDLRGHCGIWEWCVSSMPRSERLEAITVGIGTGSRHLIVDTVDEAMAWIWGLPGA
jgi:hypothetical protein